jgi:urocanate hydratase
VGQDIAPKFPNGGGKENLKLKSVSRDGRSSVHWAAFPHLYPQLTELMSSEVLCRAVLMPYPLFASNPPLPRWLVVHNNMKPYFLAGQRYLAKQRCCIERIP